MNKTRIRFFITSLGSGGAEKVLIDLLNKLDSNKYDISLTSLVGGANEKNIPANVNYHKISKAPISSIYFKVLVHLPKKLFCSLFLRGKYDIEVAYLEGFPTNAISSLKTKAKKVTFVHMDITKDDSFNDIYSTIEKCNSSYANFDKVCFVSNDVMLGFESVYGKSCKHLVLHNVLDYKNIQEKSKEETNITFKNGAFKIVVVGRLTPAKKIVRVLNIANDLKRKYNFQVLIAGNGEQYDELMQLRKKKSIDNVEFVGFQSNPYSIIAQSDLLMCSSIYEGYSTVACEALALGVPVLTTDCAGMKEILKNSELGLITENSAEALKAGLVKILEDKQSYDELKYKTLTYSKTIDFENCTRDYDNVFEELMEKLK